MNRASKIWLIVSAALILLGGVLFVAVMAAGDWDFSGLSGGTEDGSIAVSEGFDSILILGDTEDIRILPAEDGHATVAYKAGEGTTLTATVTDGTLTVSTSDDLPWYRRFFDFADTEITLYLPRAAYTALTVDISTGDTEIAAGLSFHTLDIDVSTGDVHLYADADAVSIKGSTADVEVKDAVLGSLRVEVSTGDIALSSLRCRGAVDLTVSTGKITLADVDCADLTTVGDTGDLTASDVAVAGTIRVERSTGDVMLQSLLAIAIEIKTSTGDVTFASADADKITVETSSGDVGGTLCSAKIFIPRSSSGKIRVPDSTAGGTCRITTSSGDIEITVE